MPFLSRRTFLAGLADVGSTTLAYYRRAAGAATAGGEVPETLERR
jgi:hypothetical protein